MLTITLTQKEASQLWLTLEALTDSDHGSSYLANGKHPAYKRSSFISEVGIQILQKISAKLEASSNG